MVSLGLHPAHRGRHHPHRQALPAEGSQAQAIAPHPRPRRGGTPRGPAQPRPQTNSAGPRSKPRMGRAGRRRAGPRNQEPAAATAGGPREAQSGPEAARGEPPLRCQSVTAPGTTYSSNISKTAQPLGGRSPLTMGTTQARTDPPGTQCKPRGSPRPPSSPGTPASGSHGPRRGTASKA